MRHQSAWNSGRGTGAGLPPGLKIKSRRQLFRHFRREPEPLARPTLERVHHSRARAHERFGTDLSPADRSDMLELIWSGVSDHLGTGHEGRPIFLVWWPRRSIMVHLVVSPSLDSIITVLPRNPRIALVEAPPH